MRVVLSIACIAMVAMVGGSSASTRTLPIRSEQTDQQAQKKQERVQAVQLKRLARKVGAFRTATWNCQDTLGVQRTHASVSVWGLPQSITYRGWALERWQNRASSCTRVLKERIRQWNWQAFPSWVISLARCESGINWSAEGSSSDGVFYSAFNISRSQYDRDAHYMGVRGWHEGPGVPSPYAQAMAVIGHMRLLGDGFTGRCHGIARSSWN